VAFWLGGPFAPPSPTASNEDTLLPNTRAARAHRLVFAERAVVFHRHPESLGRYLLRKWRHGYWRVRVYRDHPRKMVGDSYTPRSTQVQFLAAPLLLACLIVPRLQRYAVGPGLAFGLAVAPFVRRAWPFGLDVAAAVPIVLFLRALALWVGLAMGTLALRKHHKDTRTRRGT
jgi:hypothetical protein